MMKLSGVYISPPKVSKAKKVIEYNTKFYKDASSPVPYQFGNMANRVYCVSYSILRKRYQSFSNPLEGFLEGNAVRSCIGVDLFLKNLVNGFKLNDYYFILNPEFLTNYIEHYGTAEKINRTFTYLEKRGHKIRPLSDIRFVRGDNQMFRPLFKQERNFLITSISDVFANGQQKKDRSDH